MIICYLMKKFIFLWLIYNNIIWEFDLSNYLFDLRNLSSDFSCNHFSRFPLVMFVDSSPFESIFDHTLKTIGKFSMTNNLRTSHSNLMIKLLMTLLWWSLSTLIATFFLPKAYFLCIYNQNYHFQLSLHHKTNCLH